MNPGQPGGNPGTGDARQFSREAGVRRQAAEQLRDQLREGGVRIESLEEAIATLRRLQQEGVSGDPRERLRLEELAVDQLQRAELMIWQAFGASSAGAPAVGRASEAPPRYRQQVEEYYRSLARERP